MQMMCLPLECFGGLRACAFHVQPADGGGQCGNGGATSAEPDVAARYARGGAILRAMEQQGAMTAAIWFVHARLGALSGPHARLYPW